MAIPNWPVQQRPREKLLARGAHTLSDAELLALLLRVGVPGKSAVDLGQELLARCGGLHALLTADATHLGPVRGIGQAKLAQLRAVLELARRAMREELSIRPALNTPRAVGDFLRVWFSGYQYEAFACVLLDAQNQVLATEELFRGTLTETAVYPREVVRRALAHNAASLIVAHNHPSGRAEPSQADRELTRRLAEALDLVDVRLLDHFVVADHGLYSFAQHGLL